MNLRTEKLPLAAYAALLTVTVIAWITLPSRVPVHWGLVGPPDAWGAPYPVLSILPIVAAIVYAILFVLPVGDGGHTGVAEFQTRFPPIRAWIGVLFVGVQALMALSMAGRLADPLAASAVLIGLWLAVFGPLISNVPRNYVVGLRTPVTLSSDAAWRAGHRFGAKVFVLSGVLLALMGWTGSRVAMLVALAVLLIGSLYAGTRGAMDVER